MVCLYCKKPIHKSDYFDHSSRCSIQSSGRPNQSHGCPTCGQTIISPAGLFFHTKICRFYATLFGNQPDRLKNCIDGAARDKHISVPQLFQRQCCWLCGDVSLATVIYFSTSSIPAKGPHSNALDVEKDTMNLCANNTQKHVM